MSGKAQRGKGRPFVKADPRAGRPKGALNKTTIMGREFALGILNSEDYREWVSQRVKEHALPPAIETLLWHYAVGKPKESVEVTGANGAPVSVVEWVIRGKATD